MKRFFALLLLSSLLFAACNSNKKTTDYNKVDESFEDFKDRNPD